MTRASALPPMAPQDLEAERAVLGLALLEADAAQAVAALDPLIFHADKHRLIAEAIQRLVRRGDPVDQVTLQAELTAMGLLDDVGGPVTLANLFEAATVASQFDACLRIIEDRATRRTLMRLGREISRQAAETAGDATEGIVSEAIAQLLRLQTDGRQPGIVTPRQLAADLATTLPDVGLMTGLAPLDAHADGLRPGNLVVIAGRPGMGKTALALQLAHRLGVDEGRPVLFVSLEMSAEEIGTRFLGLLADQNARDVRLHRIPPEARRAGLERLARSGFHVWDAAAPTATTVAALIRRAVVQHRIRAAFVDHLGKVRGSQRENRYLEVGEVAQTLKTTAKQLAIPIVALCQLNRLVERRNSPRPQLADLRDSGNIEEEADAVLFLWTSEERPEGKDPLPVHLYLAKNRHGETGERAYLFQKSRGRFVEQSSRAEGA